MKEAAYQPSLFDKPETAPFDEEAGRQNRDAGIKKAVVHANKNKPGWSDLAYEILMNFLTERQAPFMTEEVRQYADEKGFPAPPSLRAWGGVIIKAAKRKYIERIGYGKTKNENAHLTPAAIWKRL